MMRRSPMNRTRFKQKSKPAAAAIASYDQLGDVAIDAKKSKLPYSLKARKPMKSRRPKATKIRLSARDEECTLRFASVCNMRTDTTVLCHSNLLIDGKGMGLKSNDAAGAYGCSACHDVLDGRAPRPDGFTYLLMQERFQVANQLTREILHRKKLLPEAIN